MVIVTVLTKASKEALQDLNGLMRELREGQSGSKPATLTELKQILADKNTVVIVAKDGERIVGVATLTIIQKLGKRIAYVEDVVVGSAFRGQGVGEKMMRKLIAVARTKKVMKLGLTSRPARVAGNELYQKVGFTQKETNVYRLNL
jgi:ribosomal protein S18 acetylase RimI-like enzyme